MQTKYHVTQRKDGKWQGKAEGNARASVVKETKADAQEATIDMKGLFNHSTCMRGTHCVRGVHRRYVGTHRG